VEVAGRYSNHPDQGERIQTILEMTPAGPSEPTMRTRKQAQHRLSPDKVDQLVSQYQSGAKVSELATLFGIHRDTVSELLDRKGVTRRRRGLSQELLNQVISAYEAGSSLAVIGDELSVDAGTVALALRKAGVLIRPCRGWPRVT
jgi:hypothetical protein